MGAASKSRLVSKSRLALLVFMWACAHPPSHAMGRIAAEHEVRTAERQRFEAMMKQDVAALDTLLDEDLTYVHTDGQMESKAELIDLIRSRRLVYESIEPSEVHVRVYEGLAITTGVSQMRVRRATGVSNFLIRFTEAYVRREGRWLLTAWQATKVST